MSEQLEQLTAQIAQMDARLAVLTDAVTAMARMQGTRLGRTELAARLEVHPSTITRWLSTDKHFPRADKTGKWRLSDILKWEDEQTAPLAGPLPGKRGTP